MIYQYLFLTSKQVISKWWTFVEGIFDATSFLPYLRNDEQSRFYQSLLYRSCLSYTIDGHKIEYKDDMCHVTTKDYQHYFVSLNSWYTRSDGVPVSNNDIFYTYNDILSHNNWDISYIKQYKEVTVSQTDNGNIKVDFPIASVDNTLFFNNFILPRHALFDADIKKYQNNFAMNPIYNKCWRIVPQSTDQYSLVFDLSACDDTHLWFYQIKNSISFDLFEEAVNSHGSIIDAYTYPKQASGYVEEKLLTNKYMTLFFNTKSKRTSVRLRRSLGWFLSYNINRDTYKKNYENILYDYDDKLFNKFLSTWANIKNFLWRVDSTTVLSKWDLLDIGIVELPETISLTWENQKLVYLIENINNIFTLNFKFDFAYDKVVIYHNNGVWYTPKSYSKKNKSGKYNIGTKFENLQAWINKYTIYGFKWSKKILVATIDVYNLKGWTLTQESIWQKAIQENLRVVYYNDPGSLAFVKHIKNIFSDYGILEHFSFDPVNSVEEMDGKLLAGDYDIVIDTINMWLKKDLSRLFGSDKPQINHSQYTSTRFISLLQQYLQAKNKQQKTLLEQVNNIYSNDMPFVIVGTVYEPLFIKEKIKDKMQWYESWFVFHQNNWRQKIYKNLQLVENINIDVNNARSLKQFWNFLHYALKKKTN